MVALPATLLLPALRQTQAAVIRRRISAVGDSNQRPSQPQAARQLQPASQLRAEAQQPVEVRRRVSQQQLAVLDGRCCCQVEVRTRHDGDRAAAVLQAQRLGLHATY
jgi:hypothetical protein